jgi:hypothetical protein
MDPLLKEVYDTLEITRRRMESYGMAHQEVDTLFYKIRDILKGQPENATEPRGTCLGTEYCTCAGLAMKNGANRDTVEQIERECPYVVKLGPVPGPVEAPREMMERLLRTIPMVEWPKFLKYEESRLSHAAMTVLVYLRPHDVKIDFDKEGKKFKVQIGATGKELTVWHEQLDVAFMETIKEIMAKAFYKQPNEL